LANTVTTRVAVRPDRGVGAGDTRRSSHPGFLRRPVGHGMPRHEFQNVSKKHGSKGPARITVGGRRSKPEVVLSRRGRRRGLAELGLTAAVPSQWPEDFLEGGQAA
jgi:hypothetical protein